MRRNTEGKNMMYMAADRLSKHQKYLKNVSGGIKTSIWRIMQNFNPGLTACSLC